MRRIAILVAPSRFMRWQQKLHERLARRWPNAEVVFRLDATKDDDLPGEITQLLALEGLTLRRARPALCDRLAPPQQSHESDEAEVVVDLTGGADTKHAALVLRPLYDGHDTDQAAMAAILAGVAPSLSIQDAATGEIVAQGLPSLECERALTTGLDAVYSRIALLIEKAIAAPRPSVARPAPIQRRPMTPRRYFLKCLAISAMRAIYRLCCHSAHWRTGWRFNDGPGVLETGSLAGPAWNALYDRDMGFAADPFPIQWGEELGVFFESMDYRTEKGAIKFQAFGPHGPTGEPVTCLEAPWHLSYPFLIEDGGGLYMAPEASLSGAITLYRCIRFPDRWEPVSTLVGQVEAADATIFRHDGRYWMTSVVRDGYGGYSDTLAIHHAPRLLGPWQEHCLSPVLIDSRYARPAGAVVMQNGALLRPVQDCSRGYGRGIALMRIDMLDPEHFKQSQVGKIYPGTIWPGRHLHTTNRCGRLELIDGLIVTPKNLSLRRLSARVIQSRPTLLNPL